MRKKILIADDDHEFVSLLKERLFSSGYDVVFAYEGIRTVEVAHKEKPDLIILDWKMPVGRGSDVLMDLRSKADSSHIPIIVLTGVHEEGMEEKALGLGAKAFLKKPCDDKILLKTIKEVLEWKTLKI